LFTQQLAHSLCAPPLPPHTRQYCNTYPLCLSLLASGRVNLKPLVTHRFVFTAEGVAAGFATAAECKDAIKVMFNLSGEEEAARA
jgi:threonine dehydrogenase-like Zn-dependent dehydrogenase